MEDRQETLDRLTPFIGTWRGNGKGMFPTLEDFDYSETFSIQRDPGASFFTYQQNTDLIDLQGRLIRKSHWEAGVIKPLENGVVEIACVQGSGRVEVSQGKLITLGSSPETLTITFHSRLIGNDEKVKRSSREWSLVGNHLHYVMKMATSHVEDLSMHLEAELFRG